MYRPWNEDPRPAWQVTAVWATPRGHHDADDQDLLLTTLRETGHVRGQTLDTPRRRPRGVAVWAARASAAPAMPP